MIRSRYSLDRRDLGDYAQACATMRVLEKRLLDGDRLEDLCEAAGAAGVLDLLRRWRWMDSGAERRPGGWEGLVTGALAASDRALLSLDPRPAVTTLLVMKYEMINLALLLKARALRAPAPEGLHPRGLTPPAVLAATAGRLDFSSYPAALGAALAEAGDAFAGDDARQIAAAVAGAHARALLAAAEEEGSGLLADYLRHRSDIENIKLRLRQLRRPQLWAQGGFSLPGGHLEAALIAGAGDEKELLDRLGRTVYTPLLRESADGGGRVSLPLLEKGGDDFLTAILQAAKYVSLGPEPLWAYWHARETDGKNVRAVLLGQLAGERGAALCRRLRKPYV